MAELKFLGPAGNGNSSDIVTLGDVTSKKGAALTSAQIDSQISTELTGYSLTSYVDSQDALRAQSSYVTTQDNTKLLKSAIGQPNGPVPLDSSGKIPTANLTSTPTSDAYSVTGLYTPSSWNMGHWSVTSRDQFAICSDITIPDPGYPYLILPFGAVDASMQVNNVDHQFAEIRVKVGSRVVGCGRAGYRITEAHACTVVPNYDGTTTPFTGAQTVKVMGGMWQAAGNTGNTALFKIGSPWAYPRLVVFIAAAMP